MLARLLDYIGGFRINPQQGLVSDFDRMHEETRDSSRYVSVHSLIMAASTCLQPGLRRKEKRSVPSSSIPKACIGSGQPRSFEQHIALDGTVLGLPLSEDPHT